MLRTKYKVPFRCRNCGKQFTKRIPIGIDVRTGTGGIMCYLYDDGYYDLKGNPHDNCIGCYIECPKCHSDDVIKAITVECTC